MGRTRENHRHLPRRLRLSHGAYYWVGRKAGKQVWLPLGRDFSKAVLRYAEIEGYTPEVTGNTFADLDARFCAQVLPTYAKNTQKSYRSWIKPLRIAFDGMPLADIKQRHAKAYRDRRPHQVSANREVALLSTMLRWAVEWGWLDANPLMGLRGRPEGPRTRYITDAEWQKLLDAAEPRLAHVLRFAYLTALRRSDIYGLRWGDVKDGVLTVQTQKTGVPLAFSVTGELARLFTDMRQGKVRSLYLFPSPTGRQLIEPTLNRWWHALRLRVGLPDVTFHDIRRKRITDVTDAHGKDAAQRLAGHKEARTTARYYQPEAIRLDMVALAPEVNIRGKEAK